MIFSSNPGDTKNVPIHGFCKIRTEYVLKQNFPLPILHLSPNPFANPHPTPSEAKVNDIGAISAVLLIVGSRVVEQLRRGNTLTLPLSTGTP